MKDYIIKKESLEGCELESAYTTEGNYIGSEKDAKYITEKRGIKPELANKNDGVCSIGFNKKEQKWYGWSHRAIYGFKVGDEITNKASGFSNIKKPFIIKDLLEAKEVAIKFSDSVS